MDNFELQDLLQQQQQQHEPKLLHQGFKSAPYEDQKDNFIDSATFQRDRLVVADIQEHLLIDPANRRYSDIAECNILEGSKPQRIELTATAKKKFHINKKLDQSKQVLIVEDNVYSAHALMSILQQYSLEFNYVINGVDAINAVKKRHESQGESYKLIFMDLLLPKMNGLKAANEIKRYEKLNKVKASYIALLSANVNEEIRGKALEIGLKTVIKKPIFKAGVQGLLIKAGIIKD